ncbi:MAG: MBL fold metallo-hydrolase [Comamonadaceae bacterium]|nr:MBL fold metallo-hydrolase [Comamonadaceae bacterium]
MKEQLEVAERALQRAGRAAARFARRSVHEVTLAGRASREPMQVVWRAVRLAGRHIARDAVAAGARRCRRRPERRSRRGHARRRNAAGRGASRAPARRGDCGRTAEVRRAAILRPLIAIQGRAVLRYEIAARHAVPAELLARSGATSTLRGGGDRSGRRAAERITAAAQRHGVRIAQILLTHAHIDHAGGTGALARKLGAADRRPAPGRPVLDRRPGRSRRAMFGFPPAEPFTPTRWLDDGDTVQVGEATLARAPLPGPHAGARGVPRRREPGAPSSATCCSPAASAAPTSPAATTTR